MRFGPLERIFLRPLLRLILAARLQRRRRSNKLPRDEGSRIVPALIPVFHVPRVNCKCRSKFLRQHLNCNAVLIVMLEDTYEIYIMKLQRSMANQRDWALDLHYTNLHVSRDNRAGPIDTDPHNLPQRLNVQWWKRCSNVAFREKKKNEMPRWKISRNEQWN